jgi:polysaccharide deacetylase family protein (PEP-CTERM system associated)
VLGWVARRFPKIVRAIHEQGHELGCHSNLHRLVYELTPTEFHEDTRIALDAIQQAAGVSVRAYRAPSFSITAQSQWAFDVLAQLGFTHDSSVFPITHDLYGFANIYPEPFRLRVPSGELIVCPMPVLFSKWVRPLPVTGGGYLRILPLWWQLYGMRRLESAGRPAVIYVHPWEFDPEQPRIAAPLKSRLRHYTGLHRTAKRLDVILRQFRLSTLTQYAANCPCPVMNLPANASAGKAAAI